MFKLFIFIILSLLLTRITFAEINKDTTTPVMDLHYNKLLLH
jgi:hypothetical protein